MFLENNLNLIKKILIVSILLLTSRSFAQDTNNKEVDNKNKQGLSKPNEGLSFQTGAFFTSNMQRRGALLYNKPIFLPLFSFRYSDWLSLGRGGLELYQNYKWGKLSFSPSYFDDQVPIFDDEQDEFRKKRKASIETQFKLNLNLIRKSKFEMTYSKEVKNHQGNFLEASFMTPVTLKFPLLKVGFGFGVGDKKHNIYLYGNGAESGLAYHEFKIGLFLPFLPRKGIAILNYSITSLSQEKNESLSYIRKNDNLDTFRLIMLWSL